MTQPAIVAAAEEIAERLLFPTALDTDAAELVGRPHLDALAAAGLYGLFGPTEYGGLDADPATAGAVIEALAGGCLTTAFVWVQHHTPVRSLRTSDNAALRDAWLADLCAGRRRAGIALGGVRPGREPLRARPVEGGWLLTGEVPYVTGWGRIGVVLTAALSEDNRLVHAFVDATTSPNLAVEPLPLLAASASSTVRLGFRDHFVANRRVTSVAPYAPPPAYDGGGRLNGSLALGVAGRCCRLIGPSPLDDELAEARRQLDAADEQSMAAARAAAAAFAWRAAGALVVHTGSRALYPSAQAQRLAREAAFLLVFGSRPPIRASLLGQLGTVATD